MPDFDLDAALAPAPQRKAESVLHAESEALRIYRNCLRHLRTVMMVGPDDVAAFAVVMLCRLGLGYHPDNDFTDYVDEAGNASLSPAEVAEFSQWQRTCHELCDENALDIYDELMDAELRFLRSLLAAADPTAELTHSVPSVYFSLANAGFDFVALSKG